MIKRILITVFNIITFVSSQRCFVMTDITNSQSLFTYQGNVYDITNYNHPGGRNTLLQVVGTALEPFLQQPRYNFHLTSNRFRNDLQRILVGVLRDNCITTTLTPPVLTTLAPLPIVTTLAPLPIVTTTLAPPPILTTLAPLPVVTTLEPPPVVTTLTPPINVTGNPVVANCVPLNLDLNISYNQQNLLADYNINNIFQDFNYIKMSLIQYIGGSRISSTNYISCGQIDVTMKTPKGFNVITSFYLETDNGDIVNFNIINKDTDKLSVIDTNFYNNLNPDFNTNSKTYDQPVILSDTFTKYSLIKTSTYYEWRINDVTLRQLNVNSTNNLSKFKISLWEAPPSTWGGPGIQWVLNPYDLLITNINVNCSIMNKSLDNPNNNPEYDPNNEYNEYYDEFYDPNNGSHILPNLNLLLFLLFIFLN